MGFKMDRVLYKYYDEEGDLSIVSEADRLDGRLEGYELEEIPFIPIDRVDMQNGGLAGILNIELERQLRLTHVSMDESLCCAVRYSDKLGFNMGCRYETTITHYRQAGSSTEIYVKVDWWLFGDKQKQLEGIIGLS